MKYLVDHDLQSLAVALEAAGIKAIHAKKILRQFYELAGSLDFEALAVGNIAKDWLGSVSLRRGSVITKTVAGDGTSKLLIGFDGGGAAESVLMLGYRDNSAAGCLSSQIGCAMGCDFCASTKSGLERNLVAGEIVEQFLHLKALANSLGRRLKTIVFMGMGEPLLNFDEVVGAIRRIADPDMGGLGWRQVTVSTVGVVPGILKLAEADLNVHLAVSLHAPDDATRSRLVPMNRKFTVADVMSAARHFYEKTNRVVTIEYCMLAGVNDSDEQADLLAELMRGFRAHVNLIPYNAIGEGVSGFVYLRPSMEKMNRFLYRLRDRGVVAHFRDTRGDDVNAACGQLRERAMASEI